MLVALLTAAANILARNIDILALALRCTLRGLLATLSTTLAQSLNFGIVVARLLVELIGVFLKW